MPDYSTLIKSKQVQHYKKIKICQFSDTSKAISWYHSLYTSIQWASQQDYNSINENYYFIHMHVDTNDKIIYDFFIVSIRHLYYGKESHIEKECLCISCTRPLQHYAFLTLNKKAQSHLRFLRMSEIVGTNSIILGFFLAFRHF